MVSTDISPRTVRRRLLYAPRPIFPKKESPNRKSGVFSDEFNFFLPSFESRLTKSCTLSTLKHVWEAWEIIGMSYINTLVDSVS